MEVKGRKFCSAKQNANWWQARWNPFDLIYIRFSPVFAVLVSSVAPTAPWTVTSPSGRQSSNSSRGLCPAAGRTGRQIKKKNRQVNSKKITVIAKWSGYALDVSQLDYYNVPANKTAKDLEKQQCCLITEDLAKLGMATANSNNL